MSKTLADRLRELRHGKTLREVEAATGVSNGYLSQLEIGAAANPSPRILKRLAEYYGVSCSELVLLATGAEETARYWPPNDQGSLIMINEMIDEHDGHKTVLCAIRKSLEESVASKANLADLARLGFDLSTYAAAINWDGRGNEPLYLEGLRALIEKYQAAYDAIMPKSELTP